MLLPETTRNVFSPFFQQLSSAGQVASGIGLNQLLNRLGGGEVQLTQSNGVFGFTPLDAVSPETAQQNQAARNAFGDFSDPNTMVLIGGAVLIGAVLLFKG